MDNGHPTVGTRTGNPSKKPHGNLELQHPEQPMSQHEGNTGNVEKWPSQKIEFMAAKLEILHHCVECVNWTPYWTKRNHQHGIDEMQNLNQCSIQTRTHWIWDI